MTSEEFKAAFAERLKSLRKSRKLTQKQLGILCGFTEKAAERSIQKWEYKEQLPALYSVRTLADALDCSLDDLIP